MEELGCNMIIKGKNGSTNPEDARLLAELQSILFVPSNPTWFLRMNTMSVRQKSTYIKMLATFN